MLSSTTPFKDTFLYMGNFHPGSMLQLIGSFLTVIISPITLGQSGYPIYINVARPEIFIYFSRFFLLVINVGALIILARKSIKITRSADIFAGLSIPLIYFASHRLSLEFISIWSPNSFNYAFGSIILMFLLIYLNTDDVDPKKLRLISIGAGIIATFQVYMITWGLGVSITILIYYLISKRNLRVAGQQWILSILQFIKGYFIGTLVIFNHFESFLDWILNLVVHQGVYGKGPKGLFNLNQFLSNVQSIVSNLPEVLIFSVILILITIILLGLSWKKINNHPGLWATAIGMIIQIIVLFLLVSKHPRDPYLLSVAAILPILLTTIVLKFRSYPLISRYFHIAIFIATFFSFSFNVINNGKKHINRVEDKTIYQHEIQSFLSNYAKSQDLNKDDLKIFWTYGTLSDCYALYFGNDYAKNLFSEELSEICGLRNEFSINVWSKKIFPDDTNTSLSTLDFKAVVIGNPENIYSLGLNDFHEYPSPVINDLSFFVQNKITP